MALSAAYRKLLAPATVMALVGVLLVLSADGLGTASANGNTRTLVRNQRIGPYEVEVGVFPGKPKVGNLHLSVVLTDAEAGNLITDAVVTVAARGPEGSTDVGPVPAENSPQTPQFFEADIPLDMEGPWAMTLEVDGGLGPVSVDIAMEVTESGISMAFLAAVAIAALIALIWIFSFVGKRRRRRRSLGRG